MNDERNGNDDHPVFEDLEDAIDAASLDWWEPSWLKQKELMTVLGLFLYDRGDQGATEEELYRIYTWAEETRMNHTMLENVLHGMMIATFSEKGEFAFKITDKGEALAREVLSIDDESGLMLLKGGKSDENVPV